MQNDKEIEEKFLKYKNLNKKDIKEFKHIGGCWGCGLKIQLEKDLKTIETLNKMVDILNKEIIDLKKELIKRFEF